MSSCGSNSILDVCVPLYVDVQETSFTVDSAWIAGAFFLGLFLGALIAALLVRPCLKEWQKKKRQDEEETVGILSAAAVAPIVTAEAVEKPSKRKKSSLFRRKKKGEQADGEAGTEDIQAGKYKGMVDVMVQTSSVGADNELAQQDVDTVASIGSDLDDERELMLLHTLDNLLKKLVVKNSITEDYYNLFMKRTKEDIKGIRKIVQTETQDAEEEARKNPRLSKDSQALENELQNIQVQAQNKLSRLQREQGERMRQDLVRSSGMSEAEVEALMQKLLAQMGALEEKLGIEQARQRRALEERLAKRRQVMEYNKMQKDNQVEDIAAQSQLFHQMVNGLVAGGKLTEKQKEELLKQFQLDINNVKSHYGAERLRQQMSLAEKLQQRRDRRLHKLAAAQEKQRATYVQTVDKGTKTSDFNEGYHELVCRQHREWEEVNTELDQADIQDLEKFNTELRNQETEEVGEKLGMQMAEVGRQANLGSTDVNQLLRQHKQQMDHYNAKKQDERQAMLAALQEKLAIRLQAIETQEQEEEVEMEAVRQQQTDTLNKVLSTNIELTDEARERILREHDQNMQMLSNQLQRSKMRQQKNMELKLSQRRARLGELQAKKDALQQNKVNMKAKEAEKLEQQLTKDIAEEEARLLAGRQAALAALRQQLAVETEEALRQQDQQIGLLIGRLQVGQARRQAILMKQDKTLKELQDQLEQKMTEGVELPRSFTDQLIQQHHNQVDHLNNHIQRSREKQERVIMEKLQAKRHMKENQLDHQMEEEAQIEAYKHHQTGTGTASGILMHTLLEQRHKKAMAELELEMKTELEKSKEELNTTLELELQQELQTQKQQFLTQLAAVSGISHDELNQAVDAAATETGMDDKKAQKLAKELRLGVKRAKSNLSETYGQMDNDDDDYGLQRVQIGDDGYSRTIDEPHPSRPGSKKKKKRGSLRPQSQLGFRPGEEDDDF